jgi:hypothetical protein
MRGAVSGAAEKASRHLDRVDALPVGSGRLGLDWFLAGDSSGGRTGGSITYDHRLAERLSVFGEGWAGYGWQDRSGFAYGALAGVRWGF